MKRAYYIIILLRASTRSARDDSAVDAFERRPLEQRSHDEHRRERPHRARRRRERRSSSPTEPQFVEAVGELTTTTVRARRRPLVVYAQDRPASASVEGARASIRDAYL